MMENNKNPNLVKFIREFKPFKCINCGTNMLVRGDDFDKLCMDCELKEELKKIRKKMWK